jgi:hypothetical protein
MFLAVLGVVMCIWVYRTGLLDILGVLYRVFSKKKSFYFLFFEIRRNRRNGVISE